MLGIAGEQNIMNRKIRVLVADDSIFSREMIKAILSEDSEISVIGEAMNGSEAVAKTAALKPDLVTMDINMPVMDGIQAIRQIMASYPVPIMVITSSSDADLAYKAISKGALEVFPKPDVHIGNLKEITNKIKVLSKVRVISHIIPLQSPDCTGRNKCEKRYENSNRIVAIASSTGGPRALSVLLSEMPGDFPAPIVIAQHIADDFVAGMANWLGSISKLRVKLAESGETPVRGTVYLCPSEKHTKINSGKRFSFQAKVPEDIYFPSCNLLLSSVAETYGANCIGIILTGMGDDGVSGIGKIRNAGGITIAQDEKTSVVFGMPRVAIESGCIDKVLPIHDMCRSILSILRGR